MKSLIIQSCLLRIQIPTNRKINRGKLYFLDNIFFAGLRRGASCEVCEGEGGEEMLPANCDIE